MNLRSPITHTTLPMVLLLAALCYQSHGLEVPGADGSDGDFRPTGANYVVDLSKATNGVWNELNQKRGAGTYDAEKWAVVFRYRSVNIPAGTTVTFINHLSRAPVVWLVSGGVSINGAVQLGGQNQQDLNNKMFSSPGPGGFRGGIGLTANGPAGSAGLGIGGGEYQVIGGGGSYLTLGGNGSMTTGNDLLVPLYGGAGGAASAAIDAGFGGGPGGGALLIATSESIILNGAILANGGSSSGIGGSSRSGSGSGGAVRLVGRDLSGSGSVSCQGGSDIFGGNTYGGLGRIRIETEDHGARAASVRLIPPTMIVPVGQTARIWPDANTPSIVIARIADETVSDDPKAQLVPVEADITLPEAKAKSVTVDVRCTSVVAGAIVRLRVVPRSGAATTVSCKFLQQISDGESLWRATNVVFTPGYAVLQAYARNP